MGRPVLTAGRCLQRMVLQHMEIHAELQYLLRTHNLASSVPVPARILQLWDYEQRQDPQVSPLPCWHVQALHS